MLPQMMLLLCLETVLTLQSALQGLTSVGNALEAQANARDGSASASGRRLLQSQEAVEGLTLSLGLLGETKESFAPKQVLFHPEL